MDREWAIVEGMRFLSAIYSIPKHTLTTNTRKKSSALPGKWARENMAAEMGIDAAAFLLFCIIFQINPGKCFTHGLVLFYNKAQELLLQCDYYFTSSNTMLTADKGIIFMN